MTSLNVSDYRPSNIITLANSTRPAAFYMVGNFESAKAKAEKIMAELESGKA